MARPFGCRTSKPRPSTAATVPYRLVRWSTAIMGLSSRVAEDGIGRHQRCRTGRASPREQGELCPAAGTADQPRADDNGPSEQRHPWQHVNRYWGPSCSRSERGPDGPGTAANRDDSGWPLAILPGAAVVTAYPGLAAYESRYEPATMPGFTAGGHAGGQSAISGQIRGPDERARSGRGGGLSRGRPPGTGEPVHR